MHEDNENGEAKAEPIAEPMTEAGYDDDFADDDEDLELARALADETEDPEEYAADDALYTPATDAAEHLRGLVAYLAANLIDDPESVEVEARQRGGSVFISLRVPEEELGKVIGRGGRIARAMRTALMIAGSRNNVRASLDIED